MLRHVKYILTSNKKLYKCSNDSHPTKNLNQEYDYYDMNFHDLILPTEKFDIKDDNRNVYYCSEYKKKNSMPILLANIKVDKFKENHKNTIKSIIDSIFESFFNEFINSTNNHGGKNIYMGKKKYCLKNIVSFLRTKRS